MKNILGFIYAFLLCLLPSCTDEFIDEQPEGKGEKVTFRMGVTISDMETMFSRALADVPTIDDPLWIVEFDEAGYLVDYAKAVNLAQEKDGSISFDVTLPSSEEKRILHFLLGYDENIHLDFGHESAVIAPLKVTGSQGVYWQRKEVPSLTAEVVEEQLRQIPLLRNYAQIEIENQADNNLKLTGYYVVHSAIYGTVSPYNHGKFVDYQRADKTIKTYDELDAEGYEGHVTDTDCVPFPTNSSQIKWTDPDVPSCFYEHKHSTESKNVFSIILKGKYGTDTKETFYKVDLVNFSEGKILSYNLLRNFKYTIHINRVVGPGKETVQEAYENPANNNLSSSVLTRNLLNVSDGESALYVSYTDTLLVSTKEIQLKYKFVNNIQKPDRTGNADVLFTLKPGPDGNIFDRIESNDKARTGWATLKLQPVKMPNHAIVQSLVVYHKKSGLSREVVFELRPKLHMDVECFPKQVSPVVGSEVKLLIKIPDQLNKNLFPLLFRIEAQEKGNVDFPMQYISPHQNEVIYTVFGNSLVPGFSDTKSFHYEKVLNHEEYVGLKKTDDQTQRIFPCTFVTNKNISASTVYVDNKYFVDADDFFENSAKPIVPVKMNAQFTKGQKVYGKGKTVMLEFTTNMAGEYKITSDGSLNFETSSGKILPELVLSVDAPGTYSVRCKTLTWNKEAVAVVQHLKSLQSVTVRGGERDQLFVKASASSNQPNENVQVTLDAKVANSKKSWSEWKTGTYITASGLNEGSKLNLSFTYVETFLFFKTTYNAKISKTAGYISENVLSLSFDKQK